MRIVVFNTAVNPADIGGDDEWRMIDGVWAADGTLHAKEADAQLYDDDVFIADAEQLNSRVSGSNAGIQDQIREMVSSGSCLICFAARNGMGWIPADFNPRGGAGREVYVVSDTILTEILERYHAEISYRTQLDQGPKWEPIVSALNGFPVGGVAQLGHGALIVLPQFQRKGPVIRDILRQVVPKMAPVIAKRRRPARIDEEAPQWFGKYTIDQAEALRKQGEQVSEQISSLERRRQEIIHEFRNTDRFRDLLWGKGENWLEPLVRDALTLLGVPCEKEPPKDAVHRYGEGQELWIEIEGTEGPIKVNKAAQLLRYMADDPEKAANVSCAIIGNPYRLEDPSNRPPAGGQEGMFSRPLTNLANKHSWPLVTTVDLFEVLRRHLAGDKTAAADIRATLGLPTPTPSRSSSKSPRRSQRPGKKR